MRVPSLFPLPLLADDPASSLNPSEPVSVRALPPLLKGDSARRYQSEERTCDMYVQPRAAPPILETGRWRFRETSLMIDLLSNRAA